MLKNFRTYQMAKELYHECHQLRLKGGMKDQFDRALLSIVLNLGEGSGKPTRKDRRKFYAIALGSNREVQTILDLVHDKARLEKADALGGMIYRLMQNPGGSS